MMRTLVRAAPIGVAARNVPGDLHTYLFYYLYPLAGLLHLFLFQEFCARLGTRFAHGAALALAVLILGWGFSHRAAAPVFEGRYEKIVSHFGLQEISAIHLFVDKEAENDQVWDVLPTLALRFRRDGVKVTVPDEYVFLCGEEMRSQSNTRPLTLVITQRVPDEHDEPYLPGERWGTFLLLPHQP
jgi:hypothetical protein